MWKVDMSDCQHEVISEGTETITKNKRTDAANVCEKPCKRNETSS